MEMKIDKTKVIKKWVYKINGETGYGTQLTSYNTTAEGSWPYIVTTETREEDTKFMVNNRATQAWFESTWSEELQEYGPFKLVCGTSEPIDYAAHEAAIASVLKHQDENC